MTRITCKIRLACLAFAWAVGATPPAAAQAPAPAPPAATDPAFRPPAVPLVACDPYFSVWSFADRLADEWPRHWTGKIQALCSLVRIDGKPFRLMGAAPKDVPALPQTGLRVHPTRTVYEFAGAGIRVTLTFLTPALPHDLDLLGRPVTYLDWTVRADDGKSHAVSIYYDNSAELVVNTPDQKVVWSRPDVGGLRVLRMGTEAQPVLARKGDDVRIDWGYLYAAAPEGSGVAAAVGAHDALREGFAAGRALPAADDDRQPRAANDAWPVMAFRWDAGEVGAEAVSRGLILAYDDLWSIKYLGRRLRPWWRRKGWEAADLLLASARERVELAAACRAFDDELEADLARAGGAAYARLAALAYRQCAAAHKLAAGPDGEPHYYPKENFSNGCIATVDVIYPACPFYLLFNPALMRAANRPVLDYALTDRWKFPFAPHDLGTYPLANGQVYGGGEKTEDNQMPVEESGNMLLMVAALAKLEGFDGAHPGGDAGFARKYWPKLAQWAEYLKAKGLDPEHQLCTDDFAGHLAHNVNLSLKAILALDAWGVLCDMAEKKEEGAAYHRLARDYAARWAKMAGDGDHYRLAFDKPGTWSQKYNLVWDRILGLGVFPPEVARKEIAYYLKMQNAFGLPLDNRKDYTKTDWLVWTATLAERREDFEALVAPAFRFANASANRVPFTDWYDTKTAKQSGFQARSVIGGVFVKMLADPAVWKKWSSRGR